MLMLSVLFAIYLFNYHDIFLESFATRQIFFRACGRQSVQSRLHVTVLNGSMYGRGGWFFKREINNSGGLGRKRDASQFSDPPTSR